jgi:hypothetical protein
VILARDVSKSGGAWGTPTRRYAISLGCEVTHAPQLVYADGLDLDRDASFQPIGISCRICERAHCHQRAVPPLERRLTSIPTIAAPCPTTSPTDRARRTVDAPPPRDYASATPDGKDPTPWKCTPPAPSPPTAPRSGPR